MDNREMEDAIKSCNKEEVHFYIVNTYKDDGYANMERAKRKIIEDDRIAFLCMQTLPFPLRREVYYTIIGNDELQRECRTKLLNEFCGITTK